MVKKQVFFLNYWTAPLLSTCFLIYTLYPSNHFQSGQGYIQSWTMMDGCWNVNIDNMAVIVQLYIARNKHDIAVIAMKMEFKTVHLFKNYVQN